MLKILVFTASLRSGAYTQKISNTAPELYAADYHHADISQLPAYNPDQDREAELNSSVRVLRQQVSQADLLLFVTPEYNAGVPGFLKNAVDWLSRPRETAALIGKRSLIVANSPSPFGGLWSAESLEKALTIAGSPVVDKLTISKINEKTDANQLVDPEARQQLTELLETGHHAVDKQEKEEYSLS